MNSSNTALVASNPAYVPAIARAALEVARRGGSPKRARSNGKKVELHFDDATGTPDFIVVNKFNFKSAFKKVARKIGGDESQLPIINQATLAAYQKPVFTNMVVEIVRQRGQVEDFRFEGNVATIDFRTKQGTKHSVSTRPEERHLALKDVVRAFGKQ